MNLGYLMLDFFLNSGNLICQSMAISMYFRESLGVRDNESRLYFEMKHEILMLKDKISQFCFDISQLVKFIKYVNKITKYISS